MEYEKAIPFKNWTTEEFIGQLGQETLFDEEGNRFVKYLTYTFAPGAVYNVPSSQANLFARQLAVRELHKLGTDKAAMLADPEVKDYMSKCFPGSKPNEKDEAGTFERIDIKDESAADAVGPKDANETKEREVPEGEDNADDEKNNAGSPKFKAPIDKVKTKDSQYV